MAEADNKKTINASPTKDFFISILVRDIKLVDAISDLVDNCVDGARRLRPDGNYKNLHISIALNSDHFMIADNCGGIPSEIAREYAFRFGRPKDAQNTPHSIGQFGVGMKRALFKIGRKFVIESKAPISEFKLAVDVDAWKSESNVDEHGREIWEFEFDELKENENFPVEECGTIITVSPLHDNIATEFSLQNFVNKLMESIETAHQKAIENGLEIEVNDVHLKYRLSTLLLSDRLKPIFKRIDKSVGDSKISVKIYAGVSEAKLMDAGWYVFCNERLILRADKSQITGWDEEINGIRTPKPHYQFARFRGYVYFDSENASLLPWNTTKNGVDVESALFQSIKLEMVNAMRPIIDFLNELDNEMDSDSTVLKQGVESANSVKLSAIPVSEIFIYPSKVASLGEKPKEMRISYTVPTEKLERAKELLKAKSNRDVGERTFAYYLKSMGED